MKWYEVLILGIGGLWLIGRYRKEHAIATAQPQVYSQGTVATINPTVPPCQSNIYIAKPSFATLPEMTNTGITTGIVPGTNESKAPLPVATQLVVAPFVPRFTAPHVYLTNPRPPGSGSERYGPSLPLVQDFPDPTFAVPCCAPSCGGTGKATIYY